ncbi:DinB family protein [Chloroflexota bacterium]
MEWQQMTMDIFDRIAMQVEGVLEGLTPDELNKQPSTGANTIGWLTWHLTRSHDRNMSEVAGKEQLWTADGWYKKFGRAADPNETGYGHSPEEMSDFRAPDSTMIIEYHRAILERIREYIENDLAETDLDRESYSPTFNNSSPVYRRITGVINDGLQHVGQAAYVRGLITEQGWYGR